MLPGNRGQQICMMQVDLWNGEFMSGRVGRRGDCCVPVDAWCWLHLVLSPLIAGAIVWFSAGSTKGGGDYCDPIYASVAERDADYRSASLAVDIASLVMLAVGAAAVVLLLRRRRAVSRLRFALGLVAAGVASCVYLFLLLIVSDLSSDCGGVRL